MKDIVAFVETPEKIVELMISLIGKNKFNDKSTRILDTGCGKGVFIKHLKNKSFSEIEGIELNEELFESCKYDFPEFRFHNTDFLDWESKKKFDVIIGNPPYAHYNSLPQELRFKVDQIVKTKESDIYYAFILRSIELLKEGGELIYIVPYGFFYNTFAKIVRESLVENGFLEFVIDLDETRLFSGENPETIIFKFIKTNALRERNISILRIKRRNLNPNKICNEAQKTIQSKTSSDYFEFHKRQMFSLEQEVWTTYPEKQIDNFSLLKDIAWVGVGLVSGFEKVFSINNDEKDELNDFEQELLIQLVKAKHCKGYWIEGMTEYFLLDDIVSTEQVLKQNYPFIYNKLKPFKNQMEVRYLPHKKRWFHWQALRNFSKFQQMIDLPKIFVPNLDRSLTNRFSLSTKPLFPSGDVLTIIPSKKDPFFLLGYLNSDFFRDYYLSAGARRGHRISYTQKIMANIKIPAFDSSVEKKIADITRRIFEEQDISFRNKIDDLILTFLD